MDNPCAAELSCVTSYLTQAMPFFAGFMRWQFFIIFLVTGACQLIACRVGLRPHAVKPSDSWLLQMGLFFKILIFVRDIQGSKDARHVCLCKLVAAC